MEVWQQLGVSLAGQVNQKDRHAAALADLQREKEKREAAVKQARQHLAVKMAVERERMAQRRLRLSRRQQELATTLDKIIAWQVDRLREKRGRK